MAPDNWIDLVGWLFVVGFMLLLAVWDAGYFYHGRHRGEYVEKPGWKTAKWTTKTGKLWITIQPNPGILTIPALIGAPPPKWEFNDGRVGRFGDLDIDQADSAPLCTVVTGGPPGSGGAWWPIGTAVIEE